MGIRIVQIYALFVSKEAVLLILFTLLVACIAPETGSDPKLLVLGMIMVVEQGVVVTVVVAYLTGLITVFKGKSLLFLWLLLHLVVVVLATIVSVQQVDEVSLGRVFSILTWFQLHPRMI